jgi:hypothetical protein
MFEMHQVSSVSELLFSEKRKRWSLPALFEEASVGHEGRGCGD